MTTINETNENVLDELYQIRKVILGDDINLLEEASRLIKDEDAFSTRMAAGLNDAIVTSDITSNKLSYGLRDPMLKSLAIAAQTRPEELSKSLAPIIGKAVVSAVAEAMRGINEQIEMMYTKSFTVKGLKWRLEAWRTGEPYTRIAMKNTHAFQIIQIAFLSKRQGKVLANFYGKGVLDQRDNNIDKQIELLENLSRSMLVTTVATDIKPVDANAQQIFVAHKPWSALAVVCWGEPPKEFTSGMLDLLIKLEAEYALDLKKFKTETAPFESVSPQLQGLFDSVVVNPKKRRSDNPKKSTSTKFWLFLVGLLLLIWVVFLTLNHLHSSKLKDQLQLQPGFVLSKIEGNVLQGWEVFGLYDPLGFNAKEVVGNSDIEENKIKFSLMPYVSLVPSIVLMRASNKLKPPNTVKLQLGTNANELIVSGVADQIWIDQIIAKNLNLLGIEKLNTAQLKAKEIQVPVIPDIKPLQTEVENVQILFKVKDIYDDNQEDRLNEIAKSIVEMEKIAKLLNKKITIKVIGHASPEGNVKANQQLKVDRAKAVISSLIQRGIEQSIFEIADPEVETDTRLVTFKVVIN